MKIDSKLRALTRVPAASAAVLSLIACALVIGSAQAQMVKQFYPQSVWAGKSGIDSLQIPRYMIDPPMPLSGGEGHNDTGVSIAAGVAVYVTGTFTQGDGDVVPTIALADADGGGANEERMRAEFFTLAAIADGASGVLYRQGLSAAGVLNTAASAVGEPVYLSTTAGAVTLSRPSGAGVIIQEVGTVAVVNASGRIHWDLGASELEDHTHADAAEGSQLTFSNTFADASIAAASMGSGAGGKFQANLLDSAQLRHLIAADAFDSTTVEEVFDPTFRETEGGGILVWNATGGAYAAGDLVALNGWSVANGRPTIALADADAAVVGGIPAGWVLRGTIGAGAGGIAYQTYRATGLNTAASAPGAPIYVSTTGTTTNTWTGTAPTAANSIRGMVGFVEVQDAVNGVIQFDPQGIKSPITRWGNLNLQAGIVSADATGRALLAAGVLDQATTLSVQAADSWDNAVLLDAVANGAYAADAPTRALFGNNFVTSALINDGDVGSIDIAVGALSADATGRAIVATGFFDNGEVLDAYAADSWDNAALLQNVADGAYADSDATRALFGDGIWSPDEEGLEVWNDSGLSVGAGDVVAVTGWNEANTARTIAVADADHATNYGELYVMRGTVANGAGGRAYKTHRLTGQNTGAWGVGAAVYLTVTGTTTNTWTNTAPVAANSRGIVVGRVAVDGNPTGVVEFNLRDPQMTAWGSQDYQAGSVDGTALAATVAGGGLAGGGGAALSVNATNGCEVVADNVQLDLLASGGLALTGTEIGVDTDTETGANIQGVNLTANGVGLDVNAIAGTNLEADGAANLRLAATAAGDALTGGGAADLDVVAGNGISVAGDAVAVVADVTTGGDVVAATVGANGVGLTITGLAGDGLLTNGAGAFGVDVSDFLGTGLVDADADEDVDIAPAYLRVATGTLTTGQLLALMTTPIEVVPAPAAGNVIEFVAATLFYDFNAAGYTVTAAGDDLAFRYTNGAGAIVSRTVDTAGFIDQANDEIRVAVQPLATDVVGAAASNIVADNIGANNWTVGDGPVRYAITYRVHATGL